MVSNHQNRKTLSVCSPKNVKTDWGRRESGYPSEKMT